MENVILPYMLIPYMNRKLLELTAEPAKSYLSISEKAFLRANAVLMKYDRELALLYSDEYVEITNSKIEKLVKIK